MLGGMTEYRIEHVFLSPHIRPERMMLTRREDMAVDGHQVKTEHGALDGMIAYNIFGALVKYESSDKGHKTILQKAVVGVYKSED